MRFRLIEKDNGVGLKDQHITGPEDSVTTSNSKTYIGSESKKKVDMNKIKNTKVGDDIHYYVNGKEGRGIVIKMDNEYLQVFKEDGQIGDIHINDTFFVKDILVNKQQQWDDMEPSDRFEVLREIHAPTPRYIAKSWHQLPPEIKELLTKEGHTFEEGETKDSETQDHNRTGYARNTQYASKCESCESFVNKYTTECPWCGKNPNVPPRWRDPDNNNAEDYSEHAFRYEREAKEAKSGKMGAGHPDWADAEKNPHWNTPLKSGPNKGKLPKHPDKGGRDDRIGRSGPISEVKQRKARLAANAHLDNHHEENEKSYQAYKKRRGAHEAAARDKKLLEHAEAAVSGGKTKTPEPQVWTPTQEKKEKPKESKPTGGFITEDDYDNKSVYKAWLEYRTKPIPDGKGGKGSFQQCINNNKDKDNPGGYCKQIERGVHGTKKSDVEHGKHGNVGGTAEVGVSTDTKYDIPEDTGYEERPHISVEEAGKLPRETYNPHGSDELHVSGEGGKDKPKFSQPHDQEQVRKVGAPQQHPNTYGMRYGMKGGVKKVWCPEHQIWEETTKDWHEQ